MAVNKHFHTSNLQGTSAEQALYANLVSEAIQIHGHDVYYLDRTLVAEDNVFGTDALSKFETQVPIEMYMEDSGGGYAGEREIMSQFGLQNLSEATFVVSKTRFQDKAMQIQIESGTDSTSSGSVLLESGTIAANKFEGSTYYIISETDATDSDRPLEGDAIYHPTLKKLFEINFVDHDSPFHQLDNNPIYKLKCRLFDYGSEELSTGITEIDAISDDLSIASSDYQLTLENASIVGELITLDFNDFDLSSTAVTMDSSIAAGDPASYGESILLETGSDEYLISEEYYIGDGVVDKTAQNELFDRLDDTVLDFSESNPFGDAGSAN